ncbi:CLUMA_CG002137, isoform A [Clunio marinus]|uniref:CLUMA_CG002137, isoform A n=1 Tax=Clunio marinus TaxID=568069 RepID=A0A1J1HJX2_9DIPT|nr:CLUMA_CG002137, isoform A [Clunio marinus]
MEILWLELACCEIEKRSEWNKNVSELIQHQKTYGVARKCLKFKDLTSFNIYLPLCSLLSKAILQDKARLRKKLSQETIVKKRLP